MERSTWYHAIMEAEENVEAQKYLAALSSSSTHTLINTHTHKLHNHHYPHRSVYIVDVL